MLHAPRVSVGRPVVTQRRALSRDSRLECAANAPMKRAYLGLLKLIRRSPWIDPRPPERLIGVDVPHAGEHPLVEKNAFHRATTPGQPLPETASRKGRPERLDAKARCQIWHELVRSEDNPGSKTPDVAIRDVRSVV